MFAIPFEVFEDGRDYLGQEPRRLNYRDSQFMPLYDASSPEQKRAALMETGDWRRVFMVKEEFFEFEEDVKEAVLGELPFRVIKRKCADGVQRCVTVQRHRKKRDECVVRYFREIDFKNPPPGLEETDLKDRGEKGYKVSVKLTVNR